MYWLIILNFLDFFCMQGSTAWLFRFLCECKVYLLHECKCTLQSTCANVSFIFELKSNGSCYRLSQIADRVGTELWNSNQHHTFQKKWGGVVHKSFLAHLPRSQPRIYDKAARQLLVQQDSQDNALKQGCLSGNCSATQAAYANKELPGVGGWRCTCSSDNQTISRDYI